MQWGEPGFELGSSAFRGRAGVVIEVAPNQFVSYVMTGTHGTLEIESDTEAIYSTDYLNPVAYIPISRIIRMEIEGYLASQEDMADRPSWARAEHEIEGRPMLKGRD